MGLNLAAMGVEVKPLAGAEQNITRVGSSLL
jgi:hypothetical protein